jgi:hypothetical protein
LTQSWLSSLVVKFNPAVPSRWLIALAGTTWCLVGLLLFRYSYVWLESLRLDRAVAFGLFGMLASVVIYRFGMSKIAQKNLNRIRATTGKSCIFGFLTWKSYGIIIIMVAAGITLRHTAVPKDYLSIIYTSMGGSLLMGSGRYFRNLWELLD